MSDDSFETTSFSFQPSHVLVIEDDNEDVFFLTCALKKLWPNCEIVTASSLEEAFMLNRRESVDLVLLDLNLPDAYGAATVNEVRRFNRNAPIVVMTGMTNDAVLNLALRNGAKAVMNKNVMTRDDFSECLHKAIH